MSSQEELLDQKRGRSEVNVVGERRKVPPLELCIGIVLVVLMPLKPQKGGFYLEIHHFSRGQLLVFRECSCDTIS